MRHAWVLLLCLAATGCTGLNEWRSVIDRGSADQVALPNSPTVREVMGQPVHDAPLLPQPGDIWTGILPKPSTSPVPAVNDTPPGPQPGNIWAGVLPNQPAAAAPPPNPPPAAGADHPPRTRPAERPLVQIASAASRHTAEQAWHRLRQRDPKLLRGHHPLIEPAEVSGRTVWRLRTDGFTGFAEADDFCASLAAQHLDCWVVAPNPGS